MRACTDMSEYQQHLPDSELTINVVPSLEDVAEGAWQALAGANPFMGYRFLRLLQESGCATPSTGWHPKYLLVHRGEDLVGAAACYLKTHSRGEFVFDQAWAQAFEQHGLRYYPKLVVAAPFSPVPGPRLLAKEDASKQVLAAALSRLCELSDASSSHVLFAEESDIAVLRDSGFMVREGVQFHWQNDDYSSVDDFLTRMSHDKRKKIRQDSKYVAAAGISYRVLEGDALTTEALRFFYECYVTTYKEHWSRPYLTAEFFADAHASRALDFVMVLAERGGSPVACAMNVKAEGRLYGRYWGTTEFVKGLHFDACYLQSIAYCIQQGLQVFEGGAQGEHKMSRGLMPTKTYSAHWIKDRRFAAAIDDFLGRETVAIDGYVDELEQGSPFKRQSSNDVV